MTKCTFCTRLGQVDRTNECGRAVPLCTICAEVWDKARFVGTQQEAAKHAAADPDNQVCILLDSIRYLVKGSLPREGGAERDKLVKQLDGILNKEADTVTVSELMQWYPKLHTAVSILLDAVTRYHDSSTLHKWDQARGK